MGNAQGGAGGGPPGQGGDGKDGKKEEKKKFEGPPPPSRVGKKKKSRGPDQQEKLPTVTPAAKCQLRLLKLNRVLDYLKMEQEFVGNQEAMKPQEEKNAAEREQMEELRGTPLDVGTMEEIIDDNHAIVSGPSTT